MSLRSNRNMAVGGDAAMVRDCGVVPLGIVNGLFEVDSRDHFEQGKWLTNWETREGARAVRDMPSGRLRRSSARLHLINDMQSIECECFCCQT